jgi:hypothetical protein
VLPPKTVADLMWVPGTSFVVDLSSLDEPERAVYLGSLAAEIETLRLDTGRPQWVLADEAQWTLDTARTGLAGFATTEKGHVIVTRRTEELPPEVLAGIDVAIACGGPDGASSAVAVVASVGELPPSLVVEALSRSSRREVVMTLRSKPHRLIRVDLAERQTPHLRHEHKYEQRGVEGSSRFYFWTPPGSDEQVVVANVTELSMALSRCSEEVVVHHARGHDISRWICDVLRDEPLSRQMSAIEDEISVVPIPAMVESGRLAMLVLLAGHTGL